MKNRPTLITKNKGIVVSYHDAAIFYATKGDGVDLKQESLPNTPYGILRSKYPSDDALTLRFDENTLKVYLRPGVLHVYGRQVEIDSEVEVFDFHSTVESAKMYCTVFIEMGFEDYTNQMAKVRINIAGANFLNFTSEGKQDNLYELDHGVYQAPIARFTYTPISERHFDNNLRLIPVLDDESVNSAEDIPMTGTINQVAMDALLENKQGTTTGKWMRASNRDALENYKSSPKHDSSTPGYSSAKEVEKLGGETIDANLSGLYSVQTITLGSIGNLGASGHTYDKTFKFDRSKAEKIRLRFDGNFQAKMTKRSWTVFKIGKGAELTEPEKDLYIEAPNLEQQESGQSLYLKPEKFYRRSASDNWFNVPSKGGTIRLVYYYQHKVQWYDDAGAYIDYWKFGIIEESKWNQVEGNDDKWSSPVPPAGGATDKRRLAYIDIIATDDNHIRIHMWSRGPIAWEGWDFIIYCWDEVSEPHSYQNNTLKGFIDVLYQGGAKVI